MNTLQQQKNLQNSLQKISQVIDQLKTIEDKYVSKKEPTDNSSDIIQNLTQEVSTSRQNLEELHENFALSGDVHQDIMPGWSLFPGLAPQFGFMNFSSPSILDSQKEYLSLMADVVHILLERLNKDQLHPTELRLIQRFQSFNQEGK